MLVAIVQELSSNGLGIIEIQNQKYQVSGVWPGDEGEFQILPKIKGISQAKLIRLIKPSSERVTVPCPYQGYDPESCGGCAWMIADYAAQLKWKQKIIQTSLIRNQIVTNTTSIKSIQPSLETSAYRNRAQLKTDGKKIGFLSSGSNQIIDIKNCLVLKPKLNQTLKKLRSQLPNHEWKPSGEEPWNFIEIHDQIKTKEIILNRKQVFKQAHDEQNEWMKNWLDAKLISLSKSLADKKVIELFCGQGNFTEIIASKNPKKIFAIESVEESLKLLKSKNLANLEIKKADLYRMKDFSFLGIDKDSEILLLDPPRTGFANINRFLDYFKNINQIIYISCDLKSLVRDAKKIIAQDFGLNELQPVDQFPHTPHIELMAVFNRS